MSRMLSLLTRRLHHLCSRIRRWFVRSRPPSKLVIRWLKKPNSKADNSFRVDQDSDFVPRPVRIATFNAALFSHAPAVPKAEKSIVFVQTKPTNSIPRGILKQSPLHPLTSENESKLTIKPKPKVSINLPVNEISLAHNRVLSVVVDSSASTRLLVNGSSRTTYDVLKEVDADVLALQDVKAEEEKEMKPLSDLARALGMSYVFAESWAPEYGNAILSKWPIKKWTVQKLCEDRDFRNVIKATIDVPGTGEMNVYTSQLDYLDENWRMKQISAMIQSTDQPHILAGGLNSLDASDYSLERWNDIVKYYEKLGKPTPKAEVTKLLRERGYTDAKDFPGECEPVVMIAKGQNVQGTCKYGTRVDYILGSCGLDYAFVPGSYSVISSRGTSDHHIVKVDVGKSKECKKQRKLKQIRVRN